MKIFLLGYHSEKSAFDICALALIPAQSLQSAAKSIGGLLAFPEQEDQESGIVIVNKEHFVTLPLQQPGKQYVIEEEHRRWGAHSTQHTPPVCLYFQILPVIQ